MRVTVEIPAWTEQATVQALADALGMEDEEVRQYLPRFLAVTVQEVVMDNLRRDVTEQMEFLAYVQGQKRKAKDKAACGKAASALMGKVG